MDQNQVGIKSNYKSINDFAEIFFCKFSIHAIFNCIQLNNILSDINCFSLFWELNRLKYSDNFKTKIYTFYRFASLQNIIKNANNFWPLIC